MKSFSIAYRVGERHDCHWVRDPRRFTTRQEAVEVAVQIERERKQKVLVYDTAALDAIGVPVGWDSDHELTPEEIRYYTSSRGKRELEERFGGSQRFGGVLPGRRDAAAQIYAIEKGTAKRRS